MKNAWNIIWNITKKIFSPPLPLLIFLCVPAGGLVAYALACLESAHPLSIIAYVFSAYCFTALCFRIPAMIGWCKRVKEQNALLSRYEKDVHFRVLLSLYASLAFGGGYALLQLGLGVYHGSVWFFAFAAYYALLFLMRFALLRTLKRKKQREELLPELRTARLCGICLLVVTPALAVIVLYIVFQGRAFSYHPIVTITMAAYTFTSLALAIIGLVSCRKYKRPAFLASKVISTCACAVSLLTLENAMLSAFGEGTDKVFLPVITSVTGIAVFALLIVCALYLILSSNGRLQRAKAYIKKKKEEKRSKKEGKAVLKTTKTDE